MLKTAMSILLGVCTAALGLGFAALISVVFETIRDELREENDDGPGKEM